MKDEIIWNLKEEGKKQADYFQAEFDKATKVEMAEWAKLVDMYAEEL